MSVTSFIEKIVGLQQQRAQAKVAGYRELIATIAAGQEPSPAEVERLLADAGKSLDDLQRDVELCQRRLGFKAAVAAMPKLEAERKSLDDRIAAADRALEAAEKRHRDKTAPHYFRRRQIDEALSAGSTAVGELVRTCEDATCTARWTTSTPRTTGCPTSASTSTAASRACGHRQTANGHRPTTS